MAAAGFHGRTFAVWTSWSTKRGNWTRKT